MLGIVIIFILNFFTGCVITPIGESVNLTEAPIGLTSETGKVSVFYYFSTVYTQIKTSLSSVTASGFTPAYKNSYYAFGVFGTILSACTLIAVSSLAIVCVVKFVKFILGRPTKNFGTWALITYFVYVLCCTMFLNLNAYSISVYGSSDTNSASVGLNGACVAGIAVGAVMFAVYYASQLVINARATFSRENLSKLICTGISIILLIVAMAIASGAAVGYEMTKTNASTSTSEITAVMSGFLTLIKNSDLAGTETAITTRINGLFAESIMAQIFSFAVLGVCAVALACTLAELIGEEHRLLNVILLGSTLVAAIAYSIFAVLSISTFVTILENLEAYKTTDTSTITYEFSTSITKVIAIDVMLLLAFVSYIIMSVIKWINKQNALALEQQTYQPVDAAASVNHAEATYADTARAENGQGGAV